MTPLQRFLAALPGGTSIHGDARLQAAVYFAQRRGWEYGYTFSVSVQHGPVSTALRSEVRQRRPTNGIYSQRSYYDRHTTLAEPSAYDWRYWYSGYVTEGYEEELAALRVFWRPLLQATWKGVVLAAAYDAFRGRGRETWDAQARATQRWAYHFGATPTDWTEAHLLLNVLQLPAAHPLAL